MSEYLVVYERAEDGGWVPTYPISRGSSPTVRPVTRWNVIIGLLVADLAGG